jgi:hypothetical protein
LNREIISDKVCYVSVYYLKAEANVYVLGPIEMHVSRLSEAVGKDTCVSTPGSDVLECRCVETTLSALFSLPLDEGE